jgi:glycolate oxidase iron-sulfur subunit
LADRLLRAVLARVLTDPALFRLASVAGWLAKPFAPVLRALGLTRLAAMVGLAPNRMLAPPGDRTGKVHPAEGPRRGRVALLYGCIGPVMAPSTNEAAIRLLNRNGVEVVVAKNEACCGSLVHHMGREEQALAQARNNIDAWTAELDAGGLDAILVTVSGCGTTVKDYGFMFRTEEPYAAKAAKVSALAKDVTEYLATLDLTPARAPLPLTVAYHSACSLQHGQRVVREPKDLLSKFGFVVKDVPESHLCCGSAGTYNILQPELAGQLRDRKVANIERLAPDVIAAGNIGCITQIGGGTAIPVVHTVELLDWASGGPVPPALMELAAAYAAASEGEVPAAARPELALLD